MEREGRGRKRKGERMEREGSEGVKEMEREWKGRGAKEENKG